MVEISIELDKVDIVNTGLSLFTHIASKVGDLNLGKLQKREVINRCYNEVKYLTIKSVEKGLYKKGLHLFHFNSFAIQNILEHQEEYSKIPLMRFGATLIILAKKQTYDKHSLNYLGTIGRGLVEKLNTSNLYYEAFIFVCEVFNILRDIIEKDLPTSSSAYLEVHRQLESLLFWLDDANVTDVTIRKTVVSYLEACIKVEEIEELNKRDILEWPKCDFS